MPDFTPEDLLKQAPWLVKYGRALAKPLVRLGVRSPEDIVNVDPNTFASLAHVGEAKVRALVAAQEEMRLRTASLSNADIGATPDTRLRDLPFVCSRYPVRLLNCLGKLGVTTVEQVLDMDPVAFAASRGVGTLQVRLLDELRAVLQALLPGKVTQSDHEGTNLGASDDPVADSTMASASDADGAVATSFASLQVSAIWEVWSQLPVPLRNCLGLHGMLTVGDVLTMQPEEFAKLRWVGVKRVQAFVELQNALRRLCLQQSAGAGAEPLLDDGAIFPEAADATACEIPWASLDDLLRDVAVRVSANRMHTTDKDRNLEIYLRYHGLGAAGERTLDAIGVAYELTRERVRQIVTRLRDIVAEEIEHGAAMAPFRQALHRTMARCLGLACTEDVGRILREEMSWQRAPSAHLIETLDDILGDTPLRLGYRHGEGLVEHPDACPWLRQRVKEKSIDLLRDIHESEHFLDFMYHLTQACRDGACQRPRSTEVVPCCGGRSGETNLPTEYVRAILSEMVPCPLQHERVLGYWWVRLDARWPRTEPVRAALHILGKPTHYADLTAFICKHNSAFKPSDDGWVLHILSSNDEYALVEKGTYGLREWGSDDKPVPVADLVEKMLRAKGAAIHQRGIVRNLKAQGIPAGTVHAALGQSRFVKDGDGWVRLAESDGVEVEGVRHGVHAPLFVSDDDAGFIL